MEMVLMLIAIAALVLPVFITADEGLLYGRSLNFTIAVEQRQINATVGGNALFSVRPSDKVSSGSWTFKEKTVCQWIGETVSVDNSYTPRAQLFTSNGSLLLKSVNKSDSGEYQVNMVPTSGPQTTATITLRVTEPPKDLTGGVIARNMIGITVGVVLMCGLVF